MSDLIEQRFSVIDERIIRQELRLDNMYTRLSELETRYSVLMSVASEVSSIKRKNDQIFNTVNKLETDLKTTQDQIFKTDVINSKIYEIIKGFIKDHENDSAIIVNKLKKTIKIFLLWFIPSLLLIGVSIFFLGFLIK